MAIEMQQPVNCSAATARSPGDHPWATATAAEDPYHEVIDVLLCDWLEEGLEVIPKILELGAAEGVIVHNAGLVIYFTPGGVEQGR